MNGAEIKEDALNTLPEQFHMLFYASAGASAPTSPTAHLRHNDHTKSVHFEESMYTTEEQGTIQSHFEINVADGACDTQFLRSNSLMRKTFICSHVHFSSKCRSSQIRGFYVDVGASHSVIGQKQLTHVLKRLGRSYI